MSVYVSLCLYFDSLQMLPLWITAHPSGSAPHLMPPCAEVVQRLSSHSTISKMLSPVSVQQWSGSSLVLLFLSSCLVVLAMERGHLRLAKRCDWTKRMTLLTSYFKRRLLLWASLKYLCKVPQRTADHIQHFINLRKMYKFNFLLNRSHWKLQDDPFIRKCIHFYFFIGHITYNNVWLIL